MSTENETNTKEQPDLIASAKEVLAKNDRGGKYTIPAEGLYPHQWLWDSCFVAIGISNYDIERAQTEILTCYAVSGPTAWCRTWC